MLNMKAIERVIDLTDPNKNMIHNITIDEARKQLATGDHESVRGIDGLFALVAKNGENVYLARSIGRPLRYFLAKRADGPRVQ